MASLDDVSRGFGSAWDDARLSRKTNGASGLAPEAFLGRDVGAANKDADRAENMGKRLAAVKFLEMEYLARQNGRKTDYGS